ncbi:uncharacterized protein K444DRAFT_608521 [Hyaloscypha bicolor E]|uniref:Uncharacterized protein n=1 Tax=Hyaloscypha bicolor E TaxID=1095630 RepID=A0A2J6TP91_9HELO|nr:uncharacterized protein K444DRAFT_608521 [Hyaloscypha bicolor E]PMD64841.1 hypothetical protein K444DRAFT_608521 [Hyaloscypha bicolor E]
MSSRIFSGRTYFLNRLANLRQVPLRGLRSDSRRSESTCQTTNVTFSSPPLRAARLTS